MTQPGVATERTGGGAAAASNIEGGDDKDEMHSCAGIGMPDKAVWLCRSCCKALCRRDPVMPFFALANWNWGGRVHPAFRELSIAMRLLQGIGRPLMRLIVLRHNEHEDEQEKGLVGNTVLLSKPTPKEVKLKLPPDETDFSDYLFGSFQHVFKFADEPRSGMQAENFRCGSEALPQMRSYPQTDLPSICRSRAR